MPGSHDATRRSLLTLLAAGAAAPAIAAEGAILVFAAMTLKDALDQVAALYRAKGPAEVTISYGPTAALVGPYDIGAGADIFFSADADWMDYARQHGLVQPRTRADLLTSRLVLIAPGDGAARSIPISRTTKLACLPGDGRLAVCDPAAMPAGRYAKAALETLGLWPRVQDRIAIAETV